MCTIHLPLFISQSYFSGKFTTDTALRQWLPRNPWRRTSKQPQTPSPRSHCTRSPKGGVRSRARAHEDAHTEAAVIAWQHSVASWTALTASELTGTRFPPGHAEHAALQFTSVAWSRQHPRQQAPQRARLVVMYTAHAVLVLVVFLRLRRRRRFDVVQLLATRKLGAISEATYYGDGSNGDRQGPRREALSLALAATDVSSHRFG